MKPPRDPSEVRVSNETYKALSRLAEEIVQEPDEELTYEGSFRTARIPEPLRSEKDEFGWLHLDGRNYWLYEEALHRLAGEKTLEHMISRDIDPGLWDLVCDLFVNRNEYQSQQARRVRLSKFLRSVERPWVDFAAIVGITDLAVTTGIRVGAVFSTHDCGGACRLGPGR